MKTARKSCIVLAGFLLAVYPVAASAAASDGKAIPGNGGYAIAKTFQIGGDGRWDYAICDSASRRIYVTRQTHVQVIDETSGQVIADLKETPGCHGVALVPELGRAFVSDGQGGAVSVFDMKTGTALGTTPAGKNPDAILYDPASKRVFAFNGKSHDVTVIDAAAAPGEKAVAGQIPLDGKPEFAATDGEGHIFVNLEDKSAIAVIDPMTMKVTNVWKLEGAEEPSGLAIDAEHHLLFAGCGNEVMAIVDSQTGKTLGAVPIGKGVDACGFDPGTGEAFASCGDGTLTVVKPDSAGKFVVEQTVKTRRGARTMALEPTTHTIYLPTADFSDAATIARRPTPKPGTFMLVVVAPAQK